MAPSRGKDRHTISGCGPVIAVEQSFQLVDRTLLDSGIGDQAYLHTADTPQPNDRGSVSPALWVDRDPTKSIT